MACQIAGQDLYVGLINRLVLPHRGMGEGRGIGVAKLPNWQSVKMPPDQQRATPICDAHMQPNWPKSVSHVSHTTPKQRWQIERKWLVLALMWHINV